MTKTTVLYFIVGKCQGGFKNGVKKGVVKTFLCLGEQEKYVII